jgi:hypothetical protein
VRGSDSISQKGTGRTAHIDTVVAESGPALVPPDSFGYAAKKSLEAMLARVYTDSITDWRLFWPKLKKAIIKRDTFTVLGFELIFGKVKGCYKILALLTPG